MIPKPPFAADLVPEVEVAAFEKLKPRLADLWGRVFPRDEEPYTSVVIPSLTLEPSELAKLQASTFYEERLLFLLIRLRNPRARLVYVTSQPIPGIVLDYYLQFLAGIPESHARARLTLLSACDGSPRPLSQKILERPRLIERIRAGIRDPSSAYLTVFNSTPLERRLAVLLGIPLNGLDPALAPLGTKSGSRKIFREAGVECPLGAEDLSTCEDVEEALLDLRARRPGLRRAVIKLNESFSGEGNALFTYPANRSRPALKRALRGIEFSVPTETCEAYFGKFAHMGGVVEEFLEAPEVSSPSAQVRVNPLGRTALSSTHEQILGGPTGQIYLGCRFPARDAYRLELQEAAMRIGRLLAAKGVVSRFSIDFLARREGPEARWRLSALEVNLRMGGTAHPMFALRFLTGGALDPETGLFQSPGGRPKYYRATDNLVSPAYRGLLPEDLIEILTINRLHYSHTTETGVLFHMIGAVSEYGKVGLVAIGNSPAEAEATYTSSVQVLETETRYGTAGRRPTEAAAPPPPQARPLPGCSPRSSLASRADRAKPEGLGPRSHGGRPSLEREAR